jgi:hypothetical protein
MATQTSTQVSGPSPYMQPYYNAFLPGAFQLANKPYESYGGPRVANMSDIEHQALSGIQGQMAGNPMMQQAQGLLGGMMQPGGGNPFMQQMIGDVSNQARQAYEQATGAINNRFTNPNSFGNSRHAMMQDQANEAFARGLGGALGQLQYGAYGEGLDRQLRAAQMAQGLQGQQFSQLMQGLQAGSVPRGIRQRQMDVGYEDFQNAQNYPFRNAEFLSRLLSGTPGSQTVTQQPGPNNTAQILGGSLATLPFLFNFFGQ